MKNLIIILLSAVLLYSFNKNEHKATNSLKKTGSTRTVKIGDEIIEYKYSDSTKNSILESIIIKSVNKLTSENDVSSFHSNVIYFDSSGHISKVHVTRSVKLAPGSDGGTYYHYDSDFIYFEENQVRRLILVNDYIKYLELNNYGRFITQSVYNDTLDKMYDFPILDLSKSEYQIKIPPISRGYSIHNYSEKELIQLFKNDVDGQIRKSQSADTLLKDLIFKIENNDYSYLSDTLFGECLVYAFEKYDEDSREIKDFILKSEIVNNPEKLENYQGTNLKEALLKELYSIMRNKKSLEKSIISINIRNSEFDSSCIFEFLKVENKYKLIRVYGVG